MAVGAGGVFVSFFLLYFVVLERVLMVACRAFTQLAADRQFAHLGLMLLGVLAQVDQAVAPFAPGLPEDMAVVVEMADTAPVAVAVASQDTEMEPAASDMGVAVSRDEIMASIEWDPTAPRTTSSTPAQPQQRPLPPRSTSLPTRRVRELVTAQTRGGVKTEPASKQASLTPSLPPAKPPKKKKRGDEFDDIFGSLDATTTTTSTKPTNPASSKDPSSADMAGSENPKKKKARTGPAEGDEFDGIFGSLDSSSSSRKPKKKKRKKGGDEFDDIFGGL